VVGRDLWGNRGGSYGLGLDTVVSKVAVALRVGIDGFYVEIAHMTHGRFSQFSVIAFPTTTFPCCCLHPDVLKCEYLLWSVKTMYHY